MCSIDFHTFTLQLAIRTSLSVVLESKFLVSSLKKCQHFRNPSTPLYVKTFLLRYVIVLPLCRVQRSYSCSRTWTFSNLFKFNVTAHAKHEHISRMFVLICIKCMQCTISGLNKVIHKVNNVYNFVQVLLMRTQ